MDVQNWIHVAERVEHARLALHAWLVKHHETVGRGLRLFDLDADGLLSAEELQRAGEQAGLDAPTTTLLVKHLGLDSGLGSVCRAKRIDALAGALEGCPTGGARLQAQAQAQAPTPANTQQTLAPPRGSSLDVGAGRASVLQTLPAERLADASRELLQQHKNLQAHLLNLLLNTDTDGSTVTLPTYPPPSPPGSHEREESVLGLLRGMDSASILRVQDAFGSSLLLLAARAGMNAVCQRLLTLEGLSVQDRLAYANRQNDMGWTALLMAAHNGQSGICGLLLTASADVNSATRGTRLSPLMLAASNGHRDVTHLLLDSAWTRPRETRADPWQTSADGRTALDFVRARLRAHLSLARDSDPQDSLNASADAKPELNLDVYRVRKPQLAPQPEPYSSIERELLDLTQGRNTPGELRQDLLLGYTAPW